MPAHTAHYRGQRHLLPHPDPATFASGRTKLPDGFVFALKGPRYAVNRRVLAGGGRFHQPLCRFRSAGAGRQAGPMLWQFTAYENSTRPTSAPSSSCCRTKLAAPNCVTSSRSSTTVSAPRVHRAGARAQRADRLCRARDLSRHPRRHRRLHLCAVAEGRRETQTATHRRRSTPGPIAQTPGQQAANQGPAARRQYACGRRNPVTHSSTSFTRQNCAPPPPPWR